MLKHWKICALGLRESSLLKQSKSRMDCGIYPCDNPFIATKALTLVKRWVNH